MYKRQGTTLLTFALAFCYLALPRDDELLSMLGGVAPVVTAHRGYSAAAPENTAEKDVPDTPKND